MDLFFLLQNVPDGRLFAIDQQALIQMAWVLINAVILAFILSKLLYKPVLNVLKNRRDRIDGEVREAEKSKTDALQLKAEYEQKMKDVEQEKVEILDTARRQAEDRSKERIAEAHTEAATLKARAEKDIELEKERAKSEMKQHIIDASSLMVTKFLSRTMDAEAHEQLFNETMAELEEIAWHN